MTSDNLARFRRMQKNRSAKALAVVDHDLVEKHLDGEIDAEQVNAVERDARYPLVEPDISVSAAEVDDLIAGLRGQFHAERFDQLLDGMKSDLTRSIVGPFGLGRVFAAYDREGGNVDTIQNVRKGIYATEEERQAYGDRPEYDSRPIHGDRRYKDINKIISEKQNTKEGVIDIYTGNPSRGADNMNLDHIVSAKGAHDDRGRVLAEVSTEDAVNRPANLGPTDKMLNQSKGASSVGEWLPQIPGKVAKLHKRQASLDDEIRFLKEKPNLTKMEAHDLREKERAYQKNADKIKKFEQVDPHKARETDKKARSDYNAHINREYYTSKKFRANTAIAAADEGFKMGIQQAVGLVVIEFLAASYDEMKRALPSIKDGASLMSVVRRCLGRVKDSILKKWKSVFLEFGSGMLSGFLSSLVTTFINVICTTGKRVVRLIREGVFSLLKALKVAFFPDEGTSYLESFHEASKLIVSGGMIIGGILLEEVVEKAVLISFPMLGNLVVPLTIAIVGAVTALATGLACYALDRMDIFGVIENEEINFVNDRLDNLIAWNEKQNDVMIGKLDGIWAENF